MLLLLIVLFSLPSTQELQSFLWFNSTLDERESIDRQSSGGAEFSTVLHTFHGQRACGPCQSRRRDARRHVCTPLHPRHPPSLINSGADRAPASPVSLALSVLRDRQRYDFAFLFLLLSCLFFFFFFFFLVSSTQLLLLPLHLAGQFLERNILACFFRVFELWSLLRNVSVFFFSSFFFYN